VPKRWAEAKIKERKMQFKQKLFGNEVELRLVVAGFYQDGSPRLDLIDAETGEPWFVCTARIDKEPSKNCVFIKDYSENTGMTRILAANGIIERLPNGMVNGFSMHKLTPAVIQMVEAARAKEAA